MDLDALTYQPTCTRCLNAFAFSQKPADLKKAEWFYRVVGPFAAPDFARGAYSVALTLRTLADPHKTEITWSTGLVLSQLDCEIDFVAWHRVEGLLDEERDEPVLVIGEAKSFGRNAIDDGSVKTLQKVAERFPGSVMVVSTLRFGNQLSLSEIGRLRRLACWGRRSWHRDAPVNPLIVLTGTELFAEHDLASAWEVVDGKRVNPTYDIRNLHTLSSLTCERYLGLGPPWDNQAAARTLSAIRDLISLMRDGKAKN